MTLTFVRLRVALAACAALGLAGCGGNPYQTAEVVGRVTCDGKPAWGGTVIFHPLNAPDQTGRPGGNPGRSASGLIAEDGSFRLTIPAAGGKPDTAGAMIGRHRVSFLLPKSTPWAWNPEDDELPPEEQEKLKAELAQRPVYPELPCSAGITPTEVDVGPGQNRFEFTLQPK